ncbi:hypothetical protein F933_03369 [Acinetobacter beijerinckii CIP 110307]|uniref:DNA-binding protein H-NS-like C-terminal domain-containing protein n=2 Tax=Acinetobacter beijerinckii TaxID=262668 RepID=N9DXL8_9GAMM|nr:hypothetical protein F933_03369 [Acinetobacter beijerinckii CIP 110307]
MTDIRNLSIEELKKLQDEAGALIVVKQEQEILDAYDKVYAIADSVGLTLEVLLEEGAKRKRKIQKKPVEPKYRNKTNSDETWTGRGKQPKWLVQEIEKGGKLEDFAI